MLRDEWIALLTSSGALTHERGGKITCTFSAELKAQEVYSFVGRRRPPVVTVQEGVRQQ